MHSHPMKRVFHRALTGAFFLIPLTVSQSIYAHGSTPLPLQGVTIPVSKGLLDGQDPMVVNKTAAIQLGKALFWDTAVGSDGMACASCHFHAGADRRTQNQLSPGLLHKTPTGSAFEVRASGDQSGVNYTLKRSDFPLHQLANPNNKNSDVIMTSDDVVASAGTFRRQFNRLATNGSQIDECQSTTDNIFHAGELNTRQVQKRQTPSVINAAFNFRNFWDGRANNIFNGVTAYGTRDVNAGIWVTQADGSTIKETLRLENAALASQAVAPPLNDTEMACSQRRFPDLARKLLSRFPLANQDIHAEDSVLASLRAASGKGLTVRYEDLIKTAFASRYWAGSGDFGKPNTINAAPYQQLEANFSLFFGLALQLYQQTLISDQSPFDTPRLPNTYPQIPEGLSTQQVRGLNVFLNAHCAVCHKGPTLTSAAHPDIYTYDSPFASLRLVNRKTLSGSFTGKGVLQGLMDEGYFNTSVTPDDNDSGVGGTDPYGNPLSFSMQYAQQLLTGKPMLDPVQVNACDLDNPFTLDFAEAKLVDDVYVNGSCGDRAINAKIPTVAAWQAELKRGKIGKAFIPVKGAFKVPSLRNVELTGPYMHNGSLATLEQVVDFYFRGGNFKNDGHFTTLVFSQTFNDQDKADLVAFLKSLTDERVRWERAPFDHPQLRIPHGHTENAGSNPKQAQDQWLNIPAVGKNGRDASLGPLRAFEHYLQP